MISIGQSSYIGDSKIITAPKCVLLNSRQSKRPCAKDTWVRGTVRAIEELSKTGCTFTTSIGLNTWELAVHLVNVVGGDQIIVLPQGRADGLEQSIDPIITDFRLERGRCGFLMPSGTCQSKLGVKEQWPERDRICVDLANILVPISIRKNGNLERLVAWANRNGKQVDTRYRVEYLEAVDRIEYSFDHVTFNPLLHDGDWNLLTHWTRSAHGPFCGVSSYEFYHDLLGSTLYPGSAFEALRHIARRQVIHGSDRFIRGGHRVVSLTGLSPLEAVRLMRWRRRYVGYSFEPYGVAIERVYAESIGFRPVLYGNDDLYEGLSSADQPFFQKSGSAVADWLPEKEWRCLEEIKLVAMPLEKVKVLTYREAEAEQLRTEIPFEVTSLTVD